MLIYQRVCQNSYWKWPIEIGDLPTLDGDFPVRYVSKNPVVNGGSDSELGVFRNSLYIPYSMGSQLELRIEFPNHQIVLGHWCYLVG